MSGDTNAAQMARVRASGYEQGYRKGVAEANAAAAAAPATRASCRTCDGGRDLYADGWDAGVDAGWAAAVDHLLALADVTPAMARRLALQEIAEQLHKAHPGRVCAAAATP